MLNRGRGQAPGLARVGFHAIPTLQLTNLEAFASPAWAWWTSPIGRTSFNLEQRAAESKLGEVLGTQSATLDVQPDQLGDVLEVDQALTRQGDAGQREGLEVARAFEV